MQRQGPGRRRGAPAGCRCSPPAPRTPLSLILLEPVASGVSTSPSHRPRSQSLTVRQHRPPLILLLRRDPPPPPPPPLSPEFQGKPGLSLATSRCGADVALAVCLHLWVWSLCGLGGLYAPRGHVLRTRSTAGHTSSVATSLTAREPRRHRLPCSDCTFASFPLNPPQNQLADLSPWRPHGQST